MGTPMYDWLVRDTGQNLGLVTGVWSGGHRGTVSVCGLRCCLQVSGVRNELNWGHLAVACWTICSQIGGWWEQTLTHLRPRRWTMLWECCRRNCVLCPHLNYSDLTIFAIFNTDRYYFLSFSFWSVCFYPFHLCYFIFSFSSQLSLLSLFYLFFETSPLFNISRSTESIVG